MKNYFPQLNPAFARFNRFVWLLTFLFWTAIVAFIIFAPILRAQGFGANWIYELFSYFCHQISERSFHIEGEKFAVCARCFGVYFGIAAGVCVYPLVRSLDDLQPLPRILLLLAPVPTTVDFALGYFGIWANTHLSRFLTALILGFGIAFFLVPGALEISRFAFRKWFKR
jgi:uncharacterized membrane protein